MHGGDKLSVLTCDLRTSPGRHQHFDPVLARCPTRTLRVDEVIDLLHVSHAPQQIEQYRLAMERGDRFPPIAVVRLGRRFFIADGHKRFQAHASFPVNHIVVQVWPLRRWFADQLSQFVRHVRRLWRLAARSIRHPAERREALHVANATTLGHWKRIVRSLTTRQPVPSNGPPRRDVVSGAPTASRLFGRLVGECLRDSGRLVLLITSMLILAAAQLSLTWVVKLWAEGPLRDGDVATMRWLLAAAAGLTAVLMLGVLASRYFLSSISHRTIQRLRDRMQERLLALSTARAVAMRGGDAISRVFHDAGQLLGFVDAVLRRLIGGGAVLIGAFAMMTYLNWRLAVATVVVIPPVAVLLQRLGRVIREHSAGAHRGAGAVGATLNDQLQGLSTIKIFRAEERERANFARQSAHYRDQMILSELWGTILVTLVWGITGFGLLAVIWYGSRQALSGGLSAGGLLAFCLYAAQTIEPLRRLSDVHGMLQRALAAAARVYEVIDCPEIERGGQAALAQPIRGEVRFENVSFGYKAGAPVLADIDFTLPPGDAVALVSATGGGKTTLASLLVRFHDPQQGRVSLDGVDTRELRLAELRRAVCLVEQDPFIFAGSLIDNLRYGCWDASRSAVESAVGLAGLEPLVRSLPAGVETWLDERGRNLSGGQRQRIALARAILREPAVLILDEALSAVDSDTEAQILTQLQGWLQRRTVLAMAHRLSTVSRFERIVVLVGGRIVDDGRLPDLVERCPQFRQLFSDQLQPLTRSGVIEGIEPATTSVLTISTG